MFSNSPKKENVFTQHVNRLRKGIRTGPSSVYFGADRILEKRHDFC